MTDALAGIGTAIPAIGTAISIGMGILGSNAASKEAKRANERDQEAYRNQLKQRKAQWFQQLSVYGARKNVYKLDLNENDLAAQRGYTQAQQGVNDAFRKALFRNEDNMIKYLESSGKLAAAGRTGRSVNRINTLDIGKLERAAGREVAMLTRTKEAFKENVETIRRKQMSERSRLYAPVAFQPVPDLAPVAPVKRSTDPTLGYLSAALTGFNTYADLGGFDKGTNNQNLALSLENNPYAPGTVNSTLPSSVWTDPSLTTYR